ncbi:CapA family protein [Sporosarcina luteola]|uniref:CapA family protein n=1 Tax=Sporosarcina luteola TaxID=582850 RepID=UPI00203E2E0A|nr:CapA family protein [Sporosarcina luteola]MCM3743944.1 CapA family protein [Sporosarcina luteola]
MKRFAIATIICNFLLTGCIQTEEEEVIRPDNFTVLQSNPYEMELHGKTTELTIGMVGDILLHYPLYTYNSYDIPFSAVKDQMTSIDLLLANQESLPGGVELGLSGYPEFNSPKHIIRDLKANGVDLLSIANNHALDQKESGLLKAIGHMNEYGMPYIGAFESAEDRRTKRIIDVKGVRIGVLAYAYGLNGAAIPKGKGYLVSLIDKNRMEAEIRELKAEADLTVVSIHWGDEYKLQPSERQVELAEWLASQGVDILFGHHPHVLQPHARIGHTEVFYSLGNFYSAQAFDSTNIGGIGKVHLSVFELAGRRFMEVEKSTFHPTAVIRDENERFVVVPLQDAVGRTSFDEKWVAEHVGLSE